MKAAIERKVVGQHALTLFDNRMTLSKNGFTQSARRCEPLTDLFDEAVARLEAWYATHGDDFLADGKFVDHILYDYEIEKLVDGYAESSVYGESANR